MKIAPFLKTSLIFLDAPIPDKKAVLTFLADASRASGAVTDRDALFEGLLRRERVMSTGIGDGIALPHAAVLDAADAAIVVIRLAGPIDFDALDNRPVDVILALILPEGQIHLHLRLLAGLSRLCKTPEFLALIRLSTDAESLRRAIQTLEEQMPFH